MINKNQPTETEETFEDIWSGEVTINEEEVKPSFRQNPNCLYLTKKDCDDIMYIDKERTFQDYLIDEFDDWFNTCSTRLPIGERNIFTKVLEYRGVRVYESDSFEDMYILDNKGRRYGFYIYDFGNMKGVNDEILFTAIEVVVYNIVNDEFEVIE